MTAPQSALREALEAHHHWRLTQTDMDEDGNVPAADYAESELAKQTRAALAAPGDTSAAKALPAQAEIEEMVKRLLADGVQFYDTNGKATRFSINPVSQEAASMLEALGKAVAALRVIKDGRPPDHLDYGVWVKQIATDALLARRQA